MERGNNSKNKSMKSTFQKPDATYPHGSLREQPEMKEPDKKDFWHEADPPEWYFDAEEYKEAWEDYEERKKSSRVIPCSENNWEDGQELEEEKDYEVILSRDGNDKYVAVPVQETEDELWNEVHKTCNATILRKSVEINKSKFTIKRKL